MSGLLPRNSSSNNVQYANITCQNLNVLGTGQIHNLVVGDVTIGNIVAASATVTGDAIVGNLISNGYIEGAGGNFSVVSYGIGGASAQIAFAYDGINIPPQFGGLISGLLYLSGAGTYPIELLSGMILPTLTNDNTQTKVLVQNSSSGLIETKNNVVDTSSTQSLTNKTITDSTNSVYANAINSATTSVVVNGASAPSTGQVLTATGSSAASWQSPATTANINDSTNYVFNNSDSTKQQTWSLSGATTGTSTTLSFSQSANRILSFPDVTDTLAGLTATQTFTNKTLTSPVIATIVNTGTLTLPPGTDVLVGRATTDTLTNKNLTSSTNNIYANAINSATTSVNVSSATAPTSGQVLTATSGTAATWQSPSTTANINDANNYVFNNADNTKQLHWSLSSASTNTKTTFNLAQTANRTITWPDATDTVTLNSQTATLGNKSLIDASTAIVNTGDSTKQLAFALVGNTSGKVLTIATAQSTSQTLSVPNITGADTICTLAATQTLTNKSIECNNNTVTIGGTNITSYLNQAVLSTSSPTFAAAILTNTTNQLVLGTTHTTTISAPAPSTSMTLTLPSGSSDTLCAIATQQQLSNKTLVDATVDFVNTSDATKTLVFSLGGNTTGKTLTLSTAQSTSQTLSVPNITGADTIATLGSGNTFTGANSMTFTTSGGTAAALNYYETGTFTATFAGPCSFTTTWHFVRTGSMVTMIMGGSSGSSSSGTYFTITGIPTRLFPTTGCNTYVCCAVGGTFGVLCKLDLQTSTSFILYGSTSNGNFPASGTCGPDTYCFSYPLN